MMDRYDDDDDDYPSTDEYEREDEDDEDVEEDLDNIPFPESTTGEQSVDISMEVDEHGNEVWYAEDSEIPGSTSKGHSVEEAMEGVDDRRREYREMLRRSREKGDRRKRNTD